MTDYNPKYCKNCKLQGHNKKDCFVIHPELYPKKEKKEGEEQKLDQNNEEDKKKQNQQRGNQREERTHMTKWQRRKERQKCEIIMIDSKNKGKRISKGEDNMIRGARNRCGT